MHAPGQPQAGTAEPPRLDPTQRPRHSSTSHRAQTAPLLQPAPRPAPPRPAHTRAGLCAIVRKRGEYRFKRVSLRMRVCGAGIVAGVGVRTILSCVRACMSARMSVCTRTCMSASVHACVCTRKRACMCGCMCACTRAVRGSLKPPLALVWLSPASFGRPAQTPRAGKPRRSRSPQTEPTLLRATTGGAGGECPTLACLARIVELARIRLLVGVEAPSSERRRMLPNWATLCCVQTPTRGHTPVATSASSAGRCWADLRDGDRSDLLLQVLDRRAWNR